MNASVSPASEGLPHPATVVLSREVRAGQEAAFLAWAEGFNEAMATFPGYLSSQRIPPVEGAQPEWVFVYTFDTALHLKAWLDSETRRAWLVRAEPLVESHGPAQIISGLEHLFGLLPPSVASPPPVWKVACSVLTGLFPVTLLNMALLAPILKPLPLVLRAFLTTLLLVVLMTWVVMPVVTRLLKPWLYPRRSRP